MRRAACYACLGLFIVLWLGSGSGYDERQQRDLIDRVTRIEQSIGQPPVGPLVPTISRQLEKLEDQIERLALKVGRTPDTGGRDYASARDLERIRRVSDANDRRLTEVERAAGRDTAARQLDLLQRQLSQLERSVDRIESRVSTLERARP